MTDPFFRGEQITKKSFHWIFLTHTSGILLNIDGVWAEELLPAAFEGAENTYDGDGNLVKSEVNGVVTYYLGKYYEKTVQNGHYAEKKHYNAGSSMIAVCTVVDGTQDTLNWLIGDHLGSTSLVTDSAGVVVSEVRYSAFGEMRYLNGETVTDLLYTGQKLDSYINLYWYNSRWYDASLGHFIQPDFLVYDTNNSIDWNRYNYYRFNPVSYVDPSGNYPDHPPLIIPIILTSIEMYYGSSAMTWIPDVRGIILTERATGKEEVSIEVAAGLAVQGIWII